MTEQLPIQLLPRGQALQRAIEARPRLFWIAPAGVTLEHVVHPSYWKHVLHAFERPWTQVECVSETGSWECVLSADGISVDGAGVDMRIISSWTDTEPMPEIPDGYLINLQRANGWSVLEKRSGTVVAQGVQRERRAREIAIAHAGSVQAGIANARKIS